MTNEASPATRLVASNLVRHLNEAVANGKQVTSDQVFAYLDHRQIFRPEEQATVLRLAVAECRKHDDPDQADTCSAACTVLASCLGQVTESETVGANSAGEA